MSDEQKVTVPELANDFESGTLVAWRKQVGESIEKGDILAEIMTDKVNMEIESPCSGVVKTLMVEEDEVVAIHQPIAIISTDTDES